MALLNSGDHHALPLVQAVRTAHTDPDSRTRKWETHPMTSWIPSWEITYEPATQPVATYRRRLRQPPDHRRCLRRPACCCLRHGQSPTPPNHGAGDDWRCPPDRPDTRHAGKATLLPGSQREKEPLATTKKWTTTGRRTGTDVV